MQYTVEVTVGTVRYSQVNSFAIKQAFNDHQTFECCFYGDIINDTPGVKGLEKYKDWLGRTILINLDNRKLEFKGIICSLKFSYEGNTGLIIVGGYSPTIQLETAMGHHASYNNVDLGTLIEKIRHNVGGNVLTWNIDDVAGTLMEYVSQYNESYFAFLNRLFKTYNIFFYYTGKTVQCGRPTTITRHKLFDVNLTELYLNMGVLPLNVENFTYEYTSVKQTTESSPGIQPANPLAKNAYEKSRSLFPRPNISPGRFEKSEALKPLLRSAMKAEIAELVNIQGKSKSPGVAIGTHLTIISKSDGGEIGAFLITDIEHHYSETGDYSNSFSGILAEAEAIKAKDVKFPYAYPQSAKVIEDGQLDPLKLGRVKVKMLWQGPNDFIDWIQVVAPGAGERSRGTTFMPEKGDEVVVGFKYGNPDRPFVIGSVVNAKRSSRINPDNGIISTGENQLYFNNEGADRSMGLKDAYTNEIRINTSANEITINSDKMLEFDAQAIKIDGNQVDINADVLKINTFELYLGIRESCGIKADTYQLTAANIHQKTVNRTANINRWSPDSASNQGSTGSASP